MQDRFLGLILLLSFLLILVACGEVPTPRSTEIAVPILPTQAAAQTDMLPQPNPLLDYPLPTLPTREPPSGKPAFPSPTPYAGPTPITLGTEFAPPEEQETYVSTTVVVASMGSGLGQVGFYVPPYTDSLPAAARHFTVDDLGNIYILDSVNQRVVKFSSDGDFLANIFYGDAFYAPHGLAADSQGRVFIYDTTGVKLFNSQSQLEQALSVPSWFLPSAGILQMKVDNQGTVWVEGIGDFPDAPTIEGQYYWQGIAPLGSATEVLTEEQQQANAVAGLMWNAGTYFGFMPDINITATYYLYDNQGNRTYACPNYMGSIETDLENNLYLVNSAQGAWYIVDKYNPQGKIVSSFEVRPGSWLVVPGGTVYYLDVDEQNSVYRIVRWQQQ